MIINFKEMARKDEPLQLRQDLDIRPLTVGRRDITGQTPMHAELEANLMAGIIRVDGQLEGEIAYSCSRCLGSLKQSMHIPFHEAFSQKTEYADPDQEVEVHYIAEDEFDLTPFLEAAVIVEIPLVVLCSEDCKGLCPACGTNRNEAECSCRTERIDPRLADLQKLLNNNS